MYKYLALGNNKSVLNT